MVQSGKSKEQAHKIRDLEELPNERLADLSERQEVRFLKLLLKKEQKEFIKKAVDGGVNKTWFTNDQFGFIFQIIAKHYVEFDSVITKDQYEEVLKKKYSKPEEVAKWNERLVGVFSAFVENSEFESLFCQMRDRFLQRQAWSINKAFSEKLLNATENQGTLVQEFISEVSNIVIPGNAVHTNVLEYRTALTEAWAEIEERRSHPERFMGLPTGFKNFDDNYVLMRGKYAVFMAPEGGGKSTLMLNIALNMARNGHHIGYVIIENDPRLTTQRTLCMHSGINFNRILKGGSEEDGLDDNTIKALKAAKEELELGVSSKFHWIKTTQGRPASEIIKQLDRIRSFCDLEAVFVDYIGIVGSDVSIPNRQDLELAHTSGKFQTYGNVNNILMVTAQQMRSEKVRELQKKFKNSSDFRVGTGDVSSTKEIAANCDYLFGILIDQENLNRMFLFNAKARYNASHKRIVLNYDRNSGQLTDAVGPEDIEVFAGLVEDENIKNKVIASTEDIATFRENMKELSETSGGTDFMDMVP